MEFVKTLLVFLVYLTLFLVASGLCRVASRRKVEDDEGKTKLALLEVSATPIRPPTGQTLLARASET